MTVGLVQLPGMMTGQILAGSSPLVAIRYQMVVVFMQGQRRRRLALFVRRAAGRYLTGSAAPALHAVAIDQSFREGCLFTSARIPAAHEWSTGNCGRLHGLEYNFGVGVG
jgi:hypothetical protein